MYIFIVSLLALLLIQQPALTNKDVIELVKMNLASEIIIAKIQNSKCGYDTSTPALKELKDAGASDAVMLAIINCQQPAEAEKPAPKKRGILGLSNVKKIYIYEMGHSDEAARFRDLLEEKFSSSDFVQTVHKPEDADAILKGTLSTSEVQGTTKARVSIRLKNQDDVELWSEDYGTRLVFKFGDKDSVKLRADDVFNGLKSAWKKSAKEASAPIRH